EASEEKQGQSRHRWDDGGRTARSPASPLVRAPRASALGGVPALDGEGAADSEGQWWDAKAWHPYRARPIHSASSAAGLATDIRSDTARGALPGNPDLNLRSQEVSPLSKRQKLDLIDPVPRNAAGGNEHQNIDHAADWQSVGARRSRRARARREQYVRVRVESLSSRRA